MSRNDPPSFFLGGALREIQKKGYDGDEVNKAWEELPCSSKSQCFDSTLVDDKIALQYFLSIGKKKTFSVLFLYRPCNMEGATSIARVRIPLKRNFPTVPAADEGGLDFGGSKTASTA